MIEMTTLHVCLFLGVIDLISPDGLTCIGLVVIQCIGQTLTTFAFGSLSETMAATFLKLAGYIFEFLAKCLLWSVQVLAPASACQAFDVI